ncbi:hypothetical protein CEXT_45331 [Caerostris extrusa]|uniref:Uncharacterized protein n=1 Tax=Caerostris extrusa TaxID=172846 RepID=A0AAV4VMB0_CAEEX|nr:hypothetical protein CEXT_45331 [Caerostris extrusa]
MRILAPRDRGLHLEKSYTRPSETGDIFCLSEFLEGPKKVKAYEISLPGTQEVIWRNRIQHLQKQEASFVHPESLEGPEKGLKVLIKVCIKQFKSNNLKVTCFLVATIGTMSC